MKITKELFDGEFNIGEKHANCFMYPVADLTDAICDTIEEKVEFFNSCLGTKVKQDFFE